MDFLNIVLKYKNVYIYEKNRNIKSCNYGIEIDNDSIVLCIYEDLVSYFNFFKFKKKTDDENILYLLKNIDYNVFKDVLEIIKDNNIKALENNIKSYDKDKMSKLINILDFLKPNELINILIYDYITDNITTLYEILKNIELKNKLFYEVVLEKLIKNIHKKIYNLYINNKNKYSYMKNQVPENFYILMKIMVDWMYKIDLNSRNKLRYLLNDAIICIKEMNYFILDEKMKKIISNDDKICDILPINVLYI